MKLRNSFQRCHFFLPCFMSLSLLMFLGAMRVSTSAPLTSHHQTRTLMGTLVTLTIYEAQETAPAHLDAAFARIEKLESLLNVHDQDSELSRLNRQAGKQPVTVSADTLNLLKEGIRIAHLTGGAFDPTVEPLIRLWRQSAKQKRLPTKQELDRVTAKVDYRKVMLDAKASSVRLLAPVTSVDLGGIAKGFAAEEAARLLAFRGVKCALVDAGGDIFALGTKPGGEPWVVGVQNPFDPYNLITKVAISDAAAVTSGNYRRFFEIGGKRFSHIIDPRSGWPADALPSVTVIAPHGAEADALATALSVLGAREGLKLIESLPQTECLLITGDKDSFKLIRSSGFAAYEIPAAGKNKS